MAVVCCVGDWLVTTCSQNLVAINISRNREPFVFDCSTAEKKPNENKAENESQGAGPEEGGSDVVLAVAMSASGNYAALTDDSKRLVLFRTRPSWQCVSTRWVVRRGTSLVFSRAEDELFVADKSGDVYSFSVVEPQRQGELKLGHLSMLLGITLSPDDKYIITADRDEKIRVSVRKSPYNIQAFCLGHTEFVSALCVPPGHPEWLISGSGDGTIKLWNYESGRRLQSIDLKQHGVQSSSAPDSEEEQRFAISRIVSTQDGRYVAVQCERLPSIQLFVLDDVPDGPLTPSDNLTLPHTPWDMTFDPQGRLWVLLENKDSNVLLYTHTQEGWQCETESPDLQTVSEALCLHWDLFKDSLGQESQFQHLYKVNFDNTASYLERKKERLQKEQGAKRRAGNGPRPSGAVKKNKMESKGGPVPRSCS
ncbi:tRNA (guanine-N(7)-)-methyltransferase non-catalytic subunit wdr4 [Brachyhypopomus gauderio]|uniref:tRNA (guanine-N(7)-)-methyltransferase non-catalytic subunit wdr4 n=1 Tax=Brachyhypopomus gauderio TaxID=698409 RepID=UPI00404205C6